MPAAIAPVIGAALGFGAASLGTALIELGLGLALSQLAQALRPKPKGNGAAGGSIRTDVTLEGGTLPQTIILGRYATAGTYVAPPYARGRLDDIPNAFRWQIVDLADVPISAVRVVWVDGTRFTIGTDLVLVGGIHRPAEATRPQWTEDADTLALNWKLGTQGAADATLVAEFGSHAERPWTSAMVGTGVAYLWAMHRYDPEIYQGEPRLKVEVDGAALYDRRRDGTDGGTGTHRPGDQATWEFTENPVTMVAAILRGIPLADGTVWGLGVAAADMPTAAWFAAANHCDQAVDSVARYRAGFEARMATADQGGDEPFDVIDELLKACAGSVADCGGSWQVRVGPPGLPVAYLTDEDIVVSRPQDFEPHRGVTDVFNAVRATHPKPSQDWAPSEAPLRVDAAAEAEDGERLVAELQLPAVWHGPQVQRLAKAYLKDARRMRRHTITLPPEYSGLLPLDVISWSSARNGYVDKLFEVFEVAIEPTTLAATLALREVNPADYDWDPADLLAGVDPSPTKVLRVLVPLPGFTAEAVILSDANGEARRPGILMTWPPTLTGVQAITWEIRILANAAPAPGGSTTNIQAGQAIASAGLLPNITYELRARGDRTGWTSWIQVTTPNVRLGEDDLAQTIIDQINAAMAQADQAAADALTAYTEALDASARLGPVEVNQGVVMTQMETLDGKAVRLTGLVASGGATTATGIEAVAWDVNGAASGSAVLLHGDNVFVPGTLATNALVVGLGSNLLPHTSFRDGTRGWFNSAYEAVGAQTTLGIRAPGTTWAGKTYPTLMLHQAGVATTGYNDLISKGVNADGTTSAETFPVEAGEWIDFSAKVSTHRCTGFLFIQFLDATGATIAGAPSVAIPEEASDSANPKLWPTYWLKAQAPAGAVAGRVFLRKNGTLSGADSYLFVYRPMVAETHAAATYPTPYSPEATTFIDGGRLITRTVEAEHLKALTITAASGVLADLAVQHFNLKGYAVAFKAAIAWRANPASPYVHAGGYRLTDATKTAPVLIQTIRINRTLGYRTRFSGSMMVSGWGTDATIHLIFERLAPGGAWIRFGDVWDNAGYRGRATSVSFIVEDTTTNAADSQSRNHTLYRMRAMKFNGPTMHNFDVHLGKLFLDVEHYKQA